MADSTNTSDDEQRELFERCKAEGELTASWRALPTDKYRMMRVQISKEIPGCEIGIRTLTRAQAVKLRDEIDSAVALIDKHLADGTGSE